MQELLRFILIDDDPFALALAKKLIQRINQYTETITFNSVREALKFITWEYSFSENAVPTVLLTDLHMPETDGLTLLSGIEKKDNSAMSQLHVFVVSAAACAEEIEKVLSHNCVTDFYSKPLSFDKMEQILKRIQYPD